MKKSDNLMRAIRRINNGSVVTSYFKLDGILSPQKNRKFLQLLNNKAENGVLGVYNNVIFDKFALSQKINLDCFNCSKLNPYGCCYSSPCSLTDEESENVFNNLTDIIRGRFSDEVVNNLLAYGVMTEDDDGNFVPLQHEHGCAFLMTTEEGYRLCAIKNWCLTNNVDIVGVCPSSCIMFPLDILELVVDEEDTYYFVTSILDDEYAEPFSRWGVGTGSGFQCLGKGEVPIEYKGKMFKKSDFVPIYREFKSLLTSWFDDETYACIEDECEGTK